MYCRLQGYPSPPLISYKIPQNPAQWVDTWTLLEVAQRRSWRGLSRLCWLRSDERPPPMHTDLENLIRNATSEQWDEWEQNAAELEVPLDYYLQEFV